MGYQPVGEVFDLARQTVFDSSCNSGEEQAAEQTFRSSKYSDIKLCPVCNATGDHRDSAADLGARDINRDSVEVLPDRDCRGAGIFASSGVCHPPKRNKLVVLNYRVGNILDWSDALPRQYVDELSPHRLYGFRCHGC